MTNLTPEEKRQRIISHAVIKFMTGNPDWFKEINRLIRRLILNNPGKREEVILKWVRSSEMVCAPTMRNKIVEIYGYQGFFKEVDPQKVRNDQ